jgi:hypothetical protein
MSYQSDFRIAANISWNMEKFPELMHQEGVRLLIYKALQESKDKSKELPLH